MTKTLIHLGRDGVARQAGKAGVASAADPLASGREILFDDGKGHRAGQLRPAAATTVSGLGHAEFLTIASGELAVDGKVYGANSAVVLPCGFSGEITAKPGTLCFFVTQESAATAGETAAITIDPALPRNPSAGPAAAVLVGPAPQCHSLNQFTDASGFRAGVWDVSTPCERIFVPHRIHELMHFLEGEVTLTHETAGPATYRAGDVVFVPQGAPYAWKNAVKVVKFYTVSG